MELSTPALGYTPHSAPLILSEGADFRHKIELTGGALFPVGTQVWIAWDNSVRSTWYAAVEGGTVRWDIEASETAALLIPNGTRYRLYISYPDGIRTNDYLWYSGWSRRMG